MFSPNMLLWLYVPEALPELEILAHDFHSNLLKR